MAKKNIEKTVLTDWEWTLVWSSMRYFMGRQTIASAMWPADLLNNYDRYLTQGQRGMIHRELKKHFEEFEAFGNPLIDSEHWERLMHYMDSNNRYMVQAKYTQDGELFEDTAICFKWKDAYCPVDKYAKNPYHNWYVAPEFIINVREIISDEQLRSN